MVGSVGPGFGGDAGLSAGVRPGPPSRPSPRRRALRGTTGSCLDRNSMWGDDSWTTWHHAPVGPPGGPLPCPSWSAARAELTYSIDLCPLVSDFVFGFSLNSIRGPLVFHS